MQALEGGFPASAAYVLPEPVATGAEYAAPAWRYDTALKPGANFNPALESARRIAMDAVSAARSKILNEIAKSETRMNVEAQLDDFAGSIATETDMGVLNNATRAIAALLEQAMTEKNADRAAELSETPEQKTNRLWGEIEAIDKDISSDLEELRRRGLLTEEEYQRLKSERERLDAMDKNDPQRIAGERAYSEHVKDDADKAKERADERGDDEGGKVADHAGKKADERKSKTDELRKTEFQKKQEKASESKKEGAKNEIGALSFSNGFDFTEADTAVPVSPSPTEAKPTSAADIRRG